MRSSTQSSSSARLKVANRAKATRVPNPLLQTSNRRADAGGSECSQPVGVDVSGPGQHPDHSGSLTRLRRIQGQIAGIEKMISEQRYCVDVLIQFRAVFSALRAVENKIFEKHLRGCVKAAMESKNPTDIDAKVEELTRLILRN